MRLMIAIPAALAAACVFGSDATTVATGEWSAHHWSAAQLWTNDTYPREGGVATFTGLDFNNSQIDIPGINCFYQDVSGLALGGFFLNNMATEFNGESVTMTGARPFVSSTRTDAWSDFTLQLNGTGANTLVKKGQGVVTLSTPAANFAAVEVADGTLVATNANASALFAANGDVRITCGTAAYRPSSASGENASAAIPSLVAAAPLARLEVSRGAADSATLTLGASTREPGAALNIAATGLGSTEKVLVSGKAATADSDAGVYTLSGGMPSFCKYDVDNGYVASASTPANVRVIGTASDVAGTVDTLDGVSFGGEGFIWRPASANGATTLKVRGTVSASSLTFLSGGGNRPVIDLSEETALSFPVHFAGVSVAAVGADTFGAGATVYVHGSLSDTASSASLDVARDTPGASAAHTYNLHLSGNGNGLGALRHTQGSWDGSIWRHSGNVVLDDDAVVFTDYNGLARIEGPISGPGGLSIMHHPSESYANTGYLELQGANSFAGTFIVDDLATAVVSGGGTLGTGPVAIGSGGALIFNDITGELNIPNKVSGDGAVVVQNSHVEFSGDVSVGILSAQQGATVGIGGTVKAADVALDVGSSIVATDADAELVVNAAVSATSPISAMLSDGNDGGTLSIVKRGAGTVEIAGGHDYSGSTTVAEGTLRLVGATSPDDISSIPGIAYWCDADDSDMVTVVNNEVTEWRSKVGDFKFVPANQGFWTQVEPSTVPEGYGSEYNGHKSIRFSGINGRMDRMKGDRSVLQRTVFIVARTDSYMCSGEPSSSGYFYGLYGEAGQDRQVRCRATDGGFPVYTIDAPERETSAGYGYENGVRKNDYIQTNNETDSSMPNVIVLLRPREVIGGYYNLRAMMVPAIGGCNGDGRNWGGDFCEIIAFSRTLTDAERRTVENYLMKKWNPDNLAAFIHADADCAAAASDVLPTGTALTVAAGATFDLNGVSQTVSTLSGNGTIVNTSSMPATLTVTDGGDFAGVVSGNVTLKRNTSSENDAASVCVENGAVYMAAGSGTTTLSPYVPAPAAGGIEFWLDASYEPETTFETREGNGVTSWQCRQAGPTIGRFTIDDESYTGEYDPTGFRGVMPAFHLAGGDTRLRAKTTGWDYATGSVRTLFIVMESNYKSDYPNRRYVIGAGGMDAALRVKGTQYTPDVSLFGTGEFCQRGDTFRVNGVDYSDNSEDYLFPENPLCIAIRISDGHAANYNNWDGQYWMIGSTWSGNDNAADADIAEIIAYNRALTDEEIAKTEQYLMGKWFGSAFPAVPTTAFDASSGAGVSDGATLNLGGGDVTLTVLAGGGIVTGFSSLTVTDQFRVFAEGDYGARTITPLEIMGNLVVGDNATVFVGGFEGLVRTARTTAISVTGTVTGNNTLPVGATNLEGTRWHWLRSGNLWRIGYGFGLMIILR